MTNKQKRDWTLILSDSIGNTRYLYKYSGSAHINLVSTDETPLALSFLAKDAARLRFELESCRDSASAKHIISHYAEYVKTVTVI